MIGAGNLSVAGNIDIKDGTGFSVNGPEQPSGRDVTDCEAFNVGNPNVCVPMGSFDIGKPGDRQRRGVLCDAETSGHLRLDADGVADNLAMERTRGSWSILGV